MTDKEQAKADALAAWKKSLQLSESEPKVSDDDRKQAAADGLRSLLASPVRADSTTSAAADGLAKALADRQVTGDGSTHAPGVRHS
ncbi:hypothetical protein LH935_16490 [Gordonia polyisoprenivorans]|uniref:hypothetical protein n=1 Tax=Gordonia polyisoprenivorans TaxID=84595 RepID=UPI0019DCF641|nr:hypothetical protein [Acetobacter sp.]UZF54344.1 hypothetical protein LH935_16490 [Gordonia polyisoprenivorans]